METSESNVKLDVEKLIESTEGVQKWGANAFALSILQRIATRQIFQDHGTRAKLGRDWSKLPSSWNIIIFGPAGAGKSSLVYTWWRALHSHVPEDQLTARNFAQSALLKKLEVGWSAADAEQAVLQTDEADSGAKKTKQNLRAKHGTKSLLTFPIQQPSFAAGGITIQDTKGQAFFDEKEQRHTDLLLQGKLTEGSSIEQENYRYWFTLGNMGLFVKTSLETSPHVVVLVFDASLRSVKKMAEGKEGGSQLECYRKVISQAQKQGLEVFVALTHLDQLEEGSPRAKQGRIGEAALEKVLDFRKKLSLALTISDKESVKSGTSCHVPEENVFVIENYRKDNFVQNASIDLAALELLESLVDAADCYVGENCPMPKHCLIS